MKIHQDIAQQTFAVTPDNEADIDAFYYVLHSCGMCWYVFFLHMFIC